MTQPQEKNLSDSVDEEPVTVELVAQVQEASETGAIESLKALIEPLKAADVADLIENLKPETRTDLIAQLGEEFDGVALTELNETVLEQVIEDLPNETIAGVVSELDSDDAVYLLEDLDESDQAEILAKVPQNERAAVERALEFPEDSAGRLMQSDLIAVPPFWTVGQTIDYMRDTEDLPDNFSEIFVVSPTYHLEGIVKLNRLLRTKRPIAIEDVMERDPNAVIAEEDQEEVARRFDRYDLLSAPVVDQDQRLVGVITVDDVVDVINEEAEEDILRMGGVGDETLADSVADATKARFLWLLVNLATAILASIVISLFDATIEQMVALAILMPIVASMGGNAATQTMTVAVRALATKELNTLNAARIITRETLVGVLNGLMFAGIVAVVAVLWFGNGQLGWVIAIAMIINMMAAALAGILVPIFLDRIGIDPAIASSVFVTTVTDVVGFFAFLGVAALWFA